MRGNEVNEISIMQPLLLKIQQPWTLAACQNHQAKGKTPKIWKSTSKPSETYSSPSPKPKFKSTSSRYFALTAPQTSSSKMFATPGPALHHGVYIGSKDLGLCVFPAPRFRLVGFGLARKLNCLVLSREWGNGPP